MPNLNLPVALSVEDIIRAVSLLDDAELETFEARFEQIWLSRMGATDSMAVDIAAQFHLPSSQQRRLQLLLAKNSEGTLTSAEEKELDDLVATYDNSLVKTADSFLELAKQRRN
ncbi:MAG: hypothetical protein KDE47_17695 [Caldilineaceae bacterium]|nr:hypothetical protein [Caldilineaceae bacterium]MCB0099215.1 hypothetical protein [Caldilineaceae bacterium]MCB9157109.1 hypothetical protein [Caldilineaceae bacterium]